LSEDFFDLIFVCIHDSELLEGLQTRLAADSQRQLRHTCADLVFTEGRGFNSRRATAADPRPLNEVNFIGIDNPMILALDFEVIGDKFDLGLLWRCYFTFLRRVETRLLLLVIPILPFLAVHPFPLK
jgi:hypothetical protein